MSARHRHHKKRIRVAEMEMRHKRNLVESCEAVMEHMLEVGIDKMHVGYHTLWHVHTNLEADVKRLAQVIDDMERSTPK